MKERELDIFTSDGRINPDKAFALVQKKMLEMPLEEFNATVSKPFEMTGVNRAVVRTVTIETVGRKTVEPNAGTD